MDDIIERIDAALACQAQGCGKSLDSSPDNSFCSPKCQQRWHEARLDLPAWYVGADSGTVPEPAGGQLHRWGEAWTQARRARYWRAGDHLTADDFALFPEPSYTCAQDYGLTQRTAQRLMRELREMSTSVGRREIM